MAANRLKSTSDTAPDGGALAGPPAGPPVLPFSEYALEQSRIFYGVTIPLAVLAVCVFGARTHQRMRRSNWTVAADDIFLSLGFLLAALDWALIIPATPLSSPRLYPAAEATNLIKYTIVAIPVWSLCMTCIKTSVALVLLRIQRQALWRAFLYTIIAAQAIYGVGNAVFVWFQCRPVAAMWDPFIPGASCLPPATLAAVSNAGAGVNIATDVLLSLAPVAFLRRLNRPPRERVAIGALIGIGLVASFASVLKTVRLRAWTDPASDQWAVGISISTWTVVEEQLAVVAACMPALKPLLEAGLRAVGISLTATARRPSQYRRATGESTFPNKDIIASGHSARVTANADAGIPLSSNLWRPEMGVAVTTDTSVEVVDKDFYIRTAGAKSGSSIVEV